jgi:Domain of unknown function (DUF4406)
MASSKCIYIAGAMSGIPEFNFPAFFAAQKKLEAEGWKVWNPADKDSEVDVQSNAAFATGDDQKLMSSGWDFRDAYLWDCEKIIRGDGIFMLKGWEKSAGARGEHAVAVSMKQRYPEYQIIYQGDQ